MALTKTGNDELTKRAFTGPAARAFERIAPTLKRGFRGGRGAAKGAYWLTRPLVKGTVRGVEATGRAAARHPGKALTIGGIGGAGLYNLKGNFKKNWMHTDPKQNLTHKAPLTQTQGLPIPRPGAITFRDPRLAEYYRSKKSDHILY